MATRQPQEAGRRVHQQRLCSHASPSASQQLAWNALQPPPTMSVHKVAACCCPASGAARFGGRPWSGLQRICRCRAALETRADLPLGLCREPSACLQGPLSPHICKCRAGLLGHVQSRAWQQRALQTQNKQMPRHACIPASTPSLPMFQTSREPEAMHAGKHATEQPRPSPSPTLPQSRLNP